MTLCSARFTDEVLIVSRRNINRRKKKIKSQIPRTCTQLQFITANNSTKLHYGKTSLRERIGFYADQRQQYV